MAKSTTYRISELATRCGVNRRTIDYYTTLGLITPLQRTGSNYRLFDESAVSIVQQIKQMQQARLTLEEIRQQLQRHPVAATAPASAHALPDLAPVPSLPFRESIDPSVTVSSHIDSLITELEQLQVNLLPLIRRPELLEQFAMESSLRQKLEALLQTDQATHQLITALLRLIH
ncbi:MerR family transcriptional regulator [Heliophilum fasciatum]|uniref:MerR-like DNA binding protein n=1 Tax=Heliophilum fasciatum TaxID=35700 RepID=A0A4R2RYR9_9FIRM|nr:MerR family transcriptional regulator [Heliophilum fasciatum]MCW2276831.1 DNA-binding transcriptional MerR regulator [Heliophilum fasciatum]TCP68708.1 MerR-like DNA binding protein [Heliophilum fasciatum]